MGKTATISSGYSADQAIGITVNDLLFRQQKTRRQLAAAMGLSHQAVSRKVLGQVGWSVSDLYAVADFFGLEVADLLPRRVEAPVKNEKSPSEEGDSKKLVAGAGFEPTTSGL
ncbi:helix-turn-helix domain-containing protein [Corynebacterium mayonis]|uniref:helix-turn-helix domain-containing protein n=1 Tax=Corynebacterium mayonis TaxID=3062461 RepID=UPI0031403324